MRKIRPIDLLRLRKFPGKGLWLGCILILAGFECVHGQNSDFELWTGACLKKNLSQVFHLQLRQEYRFYKDLTQFRENLSEVGVQVNFTPNLSFTPGYRFSVVRSGFHHRIFGDLIYKFKPIPTGLRTEIRLRTLRTFETEGKASTAIRPRVLFEFPLKKSPFTPFAGTELFYSFQDGTQGFSRYRLLAGSKVKLNDTFSLCLNYQMQHSLHKSPWLMEHIFMAGLKIDLD